MMRPRGAESLVSRGAACCMVDGMHGLASVIPVFALTTLAAAAENPLAGMLAPDKLKKAQVSGVQAAPGAKPDSVELRFPAAETPASFVVPVPDAARDWRSYALTFEFVSNSTIRWELQIRNRQGQTFTYRVQPYENVPVKAAISNAFLTREYMNNRQFLAHWLSNWGNHIDLREVEAIAVRMAPNREVTLRLGPFALVRGEVNDGVFLDRPVVDEFGQWIAGDWPGKVRSLEDLREAWKREDGELERAPDYGYCAFGGWRERTAPATGFFHTVKIEGRWWLVDPDGHLFWSAGMDCVRYRDPTRVAGRRILFQKLPPGSGETADFYQHNVRLRHGDEEFVARWKAHQARRLKAWGFNTVANWSDPALLEEPELPFVTNVRVGRSRKSWQAFPDVYSEEFLRSAEEDARNQCSRFRREPRLIGYFIGNEPRWPYRNLVDLILRDPEPSATQAFARRFLEERGDSPAARDALMETLARRYFQTVCEAVKKADPNHLTLGIRWAGHAPDPVLRANDAFDVFSINIYRFEPPAEQIQRIAEMTGRPVLIGEFHFGAAERGYAPSLVMVRDQTERGAAYQYYVEHAAAQPALIGVHYFQMVDQPVTGRFDGENYNLGFVNQQDLPYAELVRSAQRAHRRIYEIHAGRLAPVARRAQVR